MSAATASTSSNRSRSYRLWVNPSPVRAMPDSASAHRMRSDSVGAGRSLTVRPYRRARRPIPRSLVGDGVDDAALALTQVLGVDQLLPRRVGHVADVAHVLALRLPHGSPDVDVDDGE